MMYEVTFDRIGRGSRQTTEQFEAYSPDGLAEAIFRHARSKLASSWFDVTVNLEEMRGSIEFGRFGTFTIRELVDA